jgi:hypothetical protein
MIRNISVVMWVISVAVAASGSVRAEDARSSLSQALAVCQNLKNDDVLLRTTLYQGRTAGTAARDLKTGLYCAGRSAESLFWAMAEHYHGAKKAEDLAQYVRLWDNGLPKVSLFVTADPTFTGTQVSCYGTYAQSEKTGEKFIHRPYCWAVFSVNDGVSYKVMQDLHSGTGSLYSAMRTCLRDATVENVRNDLYMTCSGNSADSLLATFRDGRDGNGGRYGLDKQEVGRMGDSGTGSAVYSKSDKSEKVLFGEELGFWSSIMKLSDNASCEKKLKGAEAGQVKCRFYMGLQ